MSSILTLLTIICCGTCAFWVFVVLPTYQTKPFQAEIIKGKVRYVVDGDSLFIHGHKPQVRLWGVNTPERNEPLYNEATAFLAQIVGNHTIRCRKMHTDRYNRTVGHCFLPDGTDIGGLMIKSGYAKEMRQYSKGHYSRRR